MAEETFRFVYTAPWDSYDGSGSVQTIAARFDTSVELIRSYSHGQPWLNRPVREWIHCEVNDGEVLVVPTRGAEWHLEGGGRWVEWTPNPGDTLERILEDLKGGSPVGKLVPGRDGPWSIIPHTAASLIWYYYRNAGIRRATLKATGARDQDKDEEHTFVHFQLVLGDAKTIWVPVIPPFRRSVAVAPSSPKSPKTAATVEVAPDGKFSELTGRLHQIEYYLGVIDAQRADVLTVLEHGQTIVKAFREVHRGMEENIERWESLARETARKGLPDPSSPEAKARRRTAVAKMEELLRTLSARILEQPTWKQYHPKALDRIGAATKKVREHISDAGLTALLGELCPLMHDAPVLNSHGDQLLLLEYVCILAARAIAALANSAESADWDFVWSIADDFGPSTYAGSGSANLIAYACACANGFDLPKHPRAPSTAPHECLGVLFTERIGKDLHDIASAKDEHQARRLAQKARDALVRKFKPLLEGAGIEVEVEGREWGDTRHDLFKLLKNLKDGVSTGKEARELAEHAHLKECVKEMTTPFRGKASLAERFIPKGMRGFLAVMGVLWGVADSQNETLEAVFSTVKGESTAERVEGAADATKGAAETTSAMLEGAKKLKLFAMKDGKLLAFGEGAEATVKILGRASFVLGAASETAQIWTCRAKGQRTEAFGHLLGAEGYVCLLLAAAMPELVFIGAALVVAGIVLSQGKAVVRFLHGKLDAKVEAIAHEPEEAEDAKLYELVQRWSKDFTFRPQLEEFFAAFEGANFGEDSLFLAEYSAQPAPQRPPMHDF